MAYLPPGLPPPGTRWDDMDYDPKPTRRPPRPGPRGSTTSPTSARTPTPHDLNLTPRSPGTGEIASAECVQAGRVTASSSREVDHVSVATDPVLRRRAARLGWTTVACFAVSL